MKKVLVIDGTGRDEVNSRTKLLANRVIAKQKFRNIEYLDLYNMNIPFLNNSIQASWKSNIGNEKAIQLLEQFESADIYIFIYPTWNWSVPAIVRAYLDLVVISGRTFGYDEKGKKIGYLKNKLAVLISTTGGKTYPKVIASMLGQQSGDNYTKQILNTMGVRDIKICSIDNTAYDYKLPDGSFDNEKYMAKVNKLANNLVL